MVSSYLICDMCGQFGPPAGFLSKNGLRLCYRCWFQERQNDESPPVGNGTEPAASPARDSEPPDQSRGEP